MVEETINSSVQPSKAKTARPKPVCLWTVADVLKWLRRLCCEECSRYAENFIQHEITGRTLVRMNENTLVRLGIDNPAHRQEIWRGIMKVRLRMDLMEIMDIQRQSELYYE